MVKRMMKKICHSNNLGKATPTCPFVRMLLSHEKSELEICLTSHSSERHSQTVAKKLAPNQIYKMAGITQRPVVPFFTKSLSTL